MGGWFRSSKHPQSRLAAGSFVPRRVVETDGSTWPFGVGQKPIEDFETLIGDRVSHIANEERGAKTRVLLGIVVEERDGMTRDADRAREIISARVDRNWRIRSLSGDLKRKQGPLTELSALFGGTRPIMRAARASGLISGEKKDWVWSGCMLLLAGALSLASGLVSHLAVHSGVYTGAAIGIVFVASVLAMLAPALTGDDLPVFGHPAAKRLEQAVTADDKGTDPDVRFRERLLRELTRERPAFGEFTSQKRNRAVVIDDFGKLWPRTALLIQRYIERPPDVFVNDPREERPEEFWVVFDQGARPQSERSQPSTGHVSALATYGSFLSWQCRQQLLDPAQKKRLVRSLEPGPLDHNDRRLRYRRIGDIISGAKDHTTEKELREQLRGAGDSASVLAFSFLAIAASVPNPVPLKPTEIAMTLSAPPEKGSRDPLRDLLLAWFPNLDRPGPLGEALKNSARTLKPLFEGHKAGERDLVQVDTGCADAFMSVYQDIHHKHALPPADCAHAFWALYEQRRLAGSSSWSAPPVERMISHLRALREPGSVSYRQGEHVARALCEAALFGAHAALALHVPGIVPRHSDTPGDVDEQDGILDCALMLLAEGETPEDEALLESLLDTAWALYMLTGHGALLGSISAIADRCQVEPHSEDPLLDLYRESLATDGGASPPLPDRAAPGCQAVRDHARARALWLAAVLEPLIRRGGSDWLAETRAVSDVAMVEVIERAVARTAVAKAGAFDSLDYATLAVAGLWCTLRQTRGDPVSDALTAPFGEVGLVIAGARAARQKPSARTDFVFNGLLQMLIAIVGTTPNDLADIHMMWHSLELNELADLSGLGCNVYAAADPRMRFDDDAKCLVGVGGAGDRPINTIESDMLAGISRLGESMTSGAVPIVEAGCMAIQANLGEGFTFELSKLLVTQPLTIGYEKREQLLESALNRAPGHRGVLEIADYMLEKMVTQLFNCLADPRGTVAQRLTVALDERRGSIRSPWHADRVDQAQEYWEAGHGVPAEDHLLRALLTRWRTRIWEPGLPLSMAAAEGRRKTRVGDPVRVGNANSAGDAEVIYIYEFPSNNGQGAVGSAERKAYHIETCYMYAFVLTRTWKAVDRLEGGVLNDAIRLLGENLDLARAGFVGLACQVSTRLEQVGHAGSAAFERAVAIQRDGIAVAQTHLLPLTNYSIYEQLAKYDPESEASHRIYADSWLYEEHRLAQEQLFLQIEGHHYFEIFWYHYLRLPEPPCDLDRATVETPCSSLSTDVPEPLVFNNSGKTVLMSGSFLRLGYEVFRRRPDAPGSVAIRVKISHMAQHNIHPLYELLIGREGVSAPLRQLYEEQLRRFDDLE